MKNKILILAFALLLVSSASAEISLWNTVTTNNATQIVRYHAFYSFDDTSIQGIGKNKAIPVSLLYQVQALPFNLTYGSVDYCNFTISHYVNQYNSAGEFTNSTTETVSYYFGTGSANSSTLLFNMKSDDTLLADMDCHYTDVRSLYEENGLVGSFTTYMPSFECKGCEKYTLEELSNLADQQQNMTQNELSIYNKLQTIVNYNFQIWLIGSWIVKISLVFVGLFCVFAGVYFIYEFLKNLGRTTI